ncbi:DUF5360 family protein [Stackebrandtia nassauensis]|uniref:YvaD family protein n=1 Tax=Stackebrandtia nassauensis (strain DSM 44728 / CIP 108903 / NRRL B-16338 / NBRC 102104 / LLR-40K-21) TaxID=446470 RepID=D3QBZ4_STANL|nr:DUF5360 family protein [Stackebrandtia nassauensis]ADD44883.1 hypothetical protein Snas_5249 [Stackebrandtia nassauensis DSM 44728]
MERPPAWIKRSMLATDLGFVAYWTATAIAAIPPYPRQILIDWNWSYLVLDLLASLSGLAALLALRRGVAHARTLMVVSLALTHAAGLTALNFWVLRGEFDLMWWIPNLWLALFPIAAIGRLMRSPRRGAVTSARACRTLPGRG